MNPEKVETLEFIQIERDEFAGYESLSMCSNDRPPGSILSGHFKPIQFRVSEGIQAQEDSSSIARDLSSTTTGFANFLKIRSSGLAGRRHGAHRYQSHHLPIRLW